MTEVADGLTLWLRPGDDAIVDEVINRDVYGVVGTDMRGQVIVDVGAHIGIFATLCAYFGAARILAVEPEPDNLHVLQLNVGHWPQVTVVPGALGAFAGITHVAGKSFLAHTGDDGSCEVDQLTLDGLLDKHALNHVDLLKLDCEGAEAAILLACDRFATIARIVAETHGPETCPWVGRSRVDDIVAHLEKTHTVTVTGSQSANGYLFAERAHIPRNVGCQ